MGRTEKSQGLAPPAVRKDIRAKQARQIINKVVPALLVSNARARKGVESSELIVDPGVIVAHSKSSTKDDVLGGEDANYIKRKGQGRRKIKSIGAEDDVKKGRGKKNGDDAFLEEDMSTLSLASATHIPPRTERTIRIVTTNSLTAAHMLAFPSKYIDVENLPKPSKKAPNVCILNMASPLRPGGGVLAGATSQEEFLCARTTLLPSLHESFYRLPELGGIYTTDVLVFRSASSLGDSKGELGVSERYFVDVISAGMLRFPELEGEEDEIRRLGKKDRELVEAKMRAVLRIVARKGVRKLVLGAWGCGAYANPVIDIAQAWAKVLKGSPLSSGKKSKSSVDSETWPELEEVIFAISKHKLASEFAHAFSGNVVVEAGPDEVVEDEEEGDAEDNAGEELRAKIREMESQLVHVWNPDLKLRMGIILDGLKAQLGRKDGMSDEEDNSESDSRDEDADE